ncbi:hypothetical protein B0H10DRAFT_2224327 [Mycena sp. CBHHK59/15]|nr:hypothetical protein B0H10DRAFT_2224327 [Mycena sp. CBHHK59/15]
MGGSADLVGHDRELSIFEVLWTWRSINQGPAVSSPEHRRLRLVSGPLGTFQSLAELGDDVFIASFTTLCIELGVADTDVYTGLISGTGPILAHGLRLISLTGQTAQKFCAALMGMSDTRTLFCVVHLSDVYMDCEDFANSPATPTDPAGPNGNVHYNLPVSLADSMLDAIERLNGRFSIFTGDGSCSVVTPEDDAPARFSWLKEPEVTMDLVDINAEMASKLTAPIFPSICNQYTSFSLYDSDVLQPDLNGILAFMVDVLQAAEGAAERAWIIGHILLGSEDALSDQSNYYDQVPQRYKNTIAGQFFRHTHREIAYSNYSEQMAENAVSVVLIAPALTPTSGNPAFKVYEIDPDTFEVMDASVIFTNTSDVHFQKNPQWGLYYNTRATYGPLPRLSPQSQLSPAFWNNLTEVLVFTANTTAFQLFNTFLSRGGAVSPCDADCADTTICDMRALRSQNNCVRIGGLGLQS